MLTITDATQDDVELIFQFVRELAEYEELAHAVTGTVAELRRSLFGRQRFASAVVARLDGEAVGFALYFFNFSTFLARPGVYLEDLFVRPAYRGQGIGKALLKHVSSEAVAMGAGRLEWAVLDWNDPAIGFYRSLGAKPMDDWTVFRLAGSDLSAFGGLPSKSRIPVLDTDRLHLRPGVLGDASRLTELLQHPAFEANLASLPWPYTLVDAETHLASVGLLPDELDWLIEHHEHGVVGGLHLSINRRHLRGYLGFWLGHDYWGQGLMPEAVGAILSLAFSELALERVEAEHFDHNPASGRVMEKAGMRLEGVRRGAYRKAGIQRDAVLYAVVRADFGN